ncbi:hypothetical protein H1R20_g4306, partial [Candolleomyces eurysporus]
MMAGVYKKRAALMRMEQDAFLQENDLGPSDVPETDDELTDIEDAVNSVTVDNNLTPNSAYKSRVSKAKYLCQKEVEYCYKKVEKLKRSLAEAEKRRDHAVYKKQQLELHAKRKGIDA